VKFCYLNIYTNTGNGFLKIIF